MRVTLEFCEKKHSLLFDLGTLLTFKELSGVDLIADGDKRDNIKIAQNVFVAAYKRDCEEKEVPEALTELQLRKAFLGFTMFHITKIMDGFNCIMDVELDPELIKEAEKTPVKKTGSAKK